MSGLTDLAEKKEYLQNLVIEGCPLGHDFDNSRCPIRDICKLTAKKQVNYVNSLSEEQIDNILTYHEDCYSLFSFFTIEPPTDSCSS